MLADVDLSGNPASPEDNGTAKLTEQERAALRDRIACEALERKDRERKASWPSIRSAQ